MSISPWKPGGLPVMEEQARRSGADPGVAVHAMMQRVKVYRLTDDGKWDDQGTGHVTIDCIEGSKEIALTVVDEKDNDTLLLHNITSDDIYRKQEATIISWKDPEKALDLALSFQEAEGCSYIWQSMRTIQQNLQSNVLGSQGSPCPASESLEASRGSLSHGRTDESLVSVNDELKDLPPLELSSLPSILKTVLECGMKDQMRVAELISEDHEFFPKLKNLFRMCEGLRSMDGLHMIFRLVKGIILLNNSAIFHKIFSDDFILDIIGALEYDPEVRNVQSHRAFLQEHVVFKEAIPIRNASVVSKIHQTYRIGYIKDVILPRVLDDATMASLNAIIRANNSVVVCLLNDDASFIQDLFAKMRSSNISAESKSKLVLFLHEFCTLSKSLQAVQQLRLSSFFFSGEVCCHILDLVSEGVFDIISDVLQSRDKVLVPAGTSILMHFLNQDPNLVRTYIARHEETFQEGSSLLKILVQGVIDSGEEMHCQYCEILRNLMDSCVADTSTKCKEAVIQAFYDKHLHKLIDVIASSSPPKGITGSASGSVGVGTMVEEHSAKPEILLNICELLCFCVLHHPYKMKLNFFTSNSMEKILTLTRRREKILVVAAVRFMRTVIGRKDEFLISHIIKFNLLKPIIEAFVENGDRYNVLHSGILELLEYIRKENLEFLIEYVAESFWDQLVRFEHLGSIQAFKLKYQQIMGSAETNQSTSVVDMRNKAEERGVDKEEEDYFNKDSEGEDSDTQAKCAQKQSIPSRLKSGGLVDYNDGDDDKYFNPPPKKLVKADDDDEVLNMPMVRSSPEDGRHTDGKACKKPKLEVRVSCAKIVAAVNVTGRPDLEDKVPLLPSSSMKSSEGNDGLGVGSPGSQNQHAPENLDSVHQTRESCNDAAGSLSPKMAVTTTKSTDSESYSV
ncbi:uncharacterized protein LOC133884430 isoform X2 [Phragmites australis]|uniref:uncharacterized protein LOC133884430 isoform X2 n=1 Tax=Phragmites australis TaxID=29695 RepID=UPI002D78EEC6|nr:uncharacterized protein LOC133884430 isoform X2 [Phragmites australis]